MNHGWQSKSTDGPKGGWNVELSICLSIHLSIFLSFLSTDLSVCQPIHLSVLPSICLALYLSMQPSIHHPILVYESVRKDTVDCFHLRSGCSKPSSFPASAFTLFHQITSRNHTRNSNIHTYTASMLSDMSVPLKSPVTARILRHRLPKLQIPSCSVL